MIYVVRSERPVPGKTREFMDLVTRTTKYWAGHYKEIKQIELCRPLSGERNLVRWLVKVESLAAWERILAEAQADAEWQKLAREYAGLSAHTLNDTFYTILE